MRAISGTRRPSSSTCVFHPLKVSSSSSSSCPRRSSRTGCADSGVTRYWYQERSHATVTATSPEGLAETLGDAPHGAPVRARVEEVGGLEDGDLLLGQAAEDGLRRRDRLAVRSGEAEELAEPASPASAPVTGDRRLRRRALLDPAVLDRRLLAEGAHVHELRSLLGREADRSLAEKQRPLADAALPQRGDLRHAHRNDYSPLAERRRLPLWSHTCVFYM